MIEARADEEDVAGEDITALGRGANIDALGVAAGDERSKCDAVQGVRIVVEVVGGGIRVIIEEYSAGCDTMAGPGVDATLVGSRLRALNVVVCCLVRRSA